MTGKNKSDEKVIVYFPNLDGLRFISFFLVFLLHAFFTKNNLLANSSTYLFIRKYFIEGGHLGVNFFFVLSGFLITYLLLKEVEVKDKINVKSFYIRRILRIWPLYFFNVAFGFLIFPILKSALGQLPNEVANPYYYISFLANFDMVYNNEPDSSMLAVLWSVSIEEQFYLVWPLLLTFVKPKYFIHLNIALIVFSQIFQIINYAHPKVVGSHTISCITELSTGALVACLSIQKVRFNELISNLKKPMIKLLYAIILVLYIFRSSIFVDYLYNFEHIVYSIFFGFVIAEQCFSKNSFFKMSNFKLTSNLGKYTYGLYCLHMIAILVVETVLIKIHFAHNILQLILLHIPLSLFLAIIIAKISFNYFEKPFLTLKNKFSVIVKN